MANKIITIPGFKGGQAIGDRDSLGTQTYQKADNLDVFVDSNLLGPVDPYLQSMGLPDVAGQSSVAVTDSYYASNNKYYFIGTADISAANNVVLWSTGALAASPTWTSEYTTGGTGSSASGNLEEYKDGLFFGWSTNLDRWGDLSGSPSRTNIGTVTTGVTFIRNHRKLGLLFFIHNGGQTIGKYDNTTFTASALTLDKDEVAVGIEEWGSWCLVGIRGKTSKRSRFILWDGSSALIDDAKTLGEIGLQSFRVVNGVITYLSITNNGSNDYLRLSTMIFGAKPQTVREKRIKLSAGSNAINIKNLSTFGDTLFYGLSGSAYSNLDLGIFAYGTSAEGLPKLHTLWQKVHNNTLTDITITSINHLGESMIVTWNDSSTKYINVLTGSGILSGVSSKGVYESNIFALNNGLPDKIKRIIINHPPIPVDCGFTVQLKLFGHYSWGNASPKSDVFTVTIASPGVFTKTAHGYIAGDSVRFSSLGSLPTGLTAGTTYYVISTGLTADTFQVSTELGGSAVNTSGSQSGTHTVDGFRDLLTHEGSGGNNEEGRTQSTDYAAITEITNERYFPEARHAQLRILIDEVSGSNAPQIEFPIIIEKV